MDNSIKEILDRGFTENTKQHEKIQECLFGNGKVGIVGKVKMHEERINNLLEMHERILDKLENIEEFNAKLSAQISLWKYLISVLGVGNIASLLYFFIK